MNSYKLLAVDIDGTLCMPGQGIHLGVIESLKKCIRSEILVVFSTGKKFSSIKALCENVGIEGPVITCNGAIIIEAEKQKILFSSLLSGVMYKKIISALEHDSLNDIAVFTDRDITCTSINLASRLLDVINEPTTRFVSSLFNLSSENIAKILVAIENTDTLREVYDSYYSKYSQDCTISITSEKFLEFMSFNASKGKALVKIAKMFGIEKENIACIGDSDNDLSMFDVSGISIAVANASQAVLKAADVVVPSASDFGVVQAVNDIILKKPNEEHY